MNGYLLDTNVINELRKRKRADANVMSWFASIPEDAVFLSVLVLGEIRTGIDRLRPRDPAQARALEGWLTSLQNTYSERLLPITAAISDRWGRLNAPDRLPVIDSLMAATAL